jgi:myo-inositol-1-phosphate synthase
MDHLVGVLIIGSKGAVSTTLISAGLCAQTPSWTSSFLLPSDQEDAFASLNLSPLSTFRFGGWDICDQSYQEAMIDHQVIPKQHLDQIHPLLEQVQSYQGVTLSRTPIHHQMASDNRSGSAHSTLRPLVKALEEDIQHFRALHQLNHVVVLDLSSTAKAVIEHPAHHDLNAFENLLDTPLEDLSDSLPVSEGMLYAYAALKQNCPCINFTPSQTFDTPALIELALLHQVPVCGKDGKTGQTLYKTALAPLFKQRALKVTGWYSTNILGNRDGEVLNHQEHRQTKIESKQAVLTNILGYDDVDHQVHIHYYKPRGDAKEAWDNIDLEGWFGMPMQMKVNWLGWDSILAAPLAADLVRWMVYFHTKKRSGIINSLSSYFKSPLGDTTHAFFDQVNHLKHDVLQLEEESSILFGE